MVYVKLLFFARARELVGKCDKEVTLSSGPYTPQALLKEIVNLCVELEPITGSLMLALNEEYIDNSSTINLTHGDTIALIPPLSGG